MPPHQRHWQLLMLHGIVDGLGAGLDMEHLDLSISISSTSSNSLQRPKKFVWGEYSLSHFFVLISVVLSYFILFYFDLVNFSF